MLLRDYDSADEAKAAEKRKMVASVVVKEINMLKLLTTDNNMPLNDIAMFLSSDDAAIEFADVTTIIASNHEYSMKEMKFDLSAQDWCAKILCVKLASTYVSNLDS